ncbi:MAG TPA: hypothetical protein VFO65_01300 [Acidimicrobiales bacterium]|nr:hypothetical protein [Acidimicrobiales bacterium]
MSLDDPHDHPAPAPPPFPSPAPPGRQGPPGAGGRRWRAGIVAAGAAFGLTLAGLGVAVAQTDGTTTAPPVSGADPAPEAVKPRPLHREGGHKPAGGPRMGPGAGMGMGIHGEFTTRAPGGGYQTLATQHGEVTEVSALALTARSEDGYSRTYVVDDGTLVNAGNEGIADVKVGDRVHVVAVVTDGTARAVSVQDLTQVRALHDKWAPPHRGPGPEPVPAPDGGTD